MTRVAIVGVGLIGGSLGLALREARPDIEVLGIARTEDKASAAVKRGAVTAAGTDLRLASACDVVVVATPLQEMRPVFSFLGRELPKDTLLTDVGSVKRPVLDWARELIPDTGRFLGGHPMAGKSESGLRAAEARLFKDATWVFTPDGDQDLGRFAPLFELVDAVGARRVVIGPDEHDRRVALVSHLAFTLSSAYGATIKGSPEWREAVRIAGPGFRDMVRLAGGDPDLYTGIARTNRAALLDAVERFQAALTKYRRHLENDDERIWELFEEVKLAHDQWERL